MERHSNIRGHYGLFIHHSTSKHQGKKKKMNPYPEKDHSINFDFKERQN